MNDNTLVVIEKNGSTVLRRIRDAAFVGAVGASTALVSANSSAVSELDFTGASTELTGSKTAVIGIIGILMTLIGIGIAWSYFKRTAQ